MARFTRVEMVVVGESEGTIVVISGVVVMVIVAVVVGRRLFSRCLRAKRKRARSFARLELGDKVVGGDGSRGIVMLGASGVVVLEVVGVVLVDVDED